MTRDHDLEHLVQDDQVKSEVTTRIESAERPRDEDVVWKVFFMLGACREGVTHDELAEELGVSRRTAERATKVFRDGQPSLVKPGERDHSYTLDLESLKTFESNRSKARRLFSKYVGAPS